ncbi:protein of unknown function [Shewanella benthica]|uniref:Uncharacterized protein n=1 Tax=Shewanella benthica TaxID=43661 RepID=A0A330M236_9GAMM|nr:hypothetical protein [Shewanella benthica]SQH75524.1 protein of unknown function [Shewanella benthica]
MKQKPIPQSNQPRESKNHVILPKDLAIRSELLLKMPDGVSSNEWHEVYHAPSARNTPSDLKRKFGIDIINPHCKKSSSGKNYWPHFLRDKAAAKQLAKLVEVSRAAYQLSPIPGLNNLLKAFN